MPTRGKVFLPLVLGLCSVSGAVHLTVSFFFFKEQSIAIYRVDTSISV